MRTCTVEYEEVDAKVGYRGLGTRRITLPVVYMYENGKRVNSVMCRTEEDATRRADAFLKDGVA